MAESPPTGSLVPRIEHELRTRLEQLDTERAAVLAALAVLGPQAASAPAAPPAARRRRPRLTEATVLAAVADDPGIRASLLALTLDVPAERVMRMLERLREQGAVERSGLGWEAVAADKQEMRAGHGGD